MSYCNYNLCGIESGSVFIKSLNMLEMLEELSSLHELSDEEDLFRSLECVTEIDQIGMIDVL